MILPDHTLAKWASGGGIDPYDETHINPASIDLCMGMEIIELMSSKRMSIRETGLLVVPGNPILATTFEYIKIPSEYAGVLYLKSSPAREGLDHALAGFVDPGFEGELTMELHAHRPVYLEYKQPVVQLVLYRMESEPHVLYQGKYQGQRGPTAAK